MQGDSFPQPLGVHLAPRRRSKQGRWMFLPPYSCLHVFWFFFPFSFFLSNGIVMQASSRIWTQKLLTVAHEAAAKHIKGIATHALYYASSTPHQYRLRTATSVLSVVVEKVIATVGL
ncbi:hypothetical protein CONLIGDRAFT_54636 [Coniochaeta ligniaria NRRL 30616]|uniref:Uncharacterized protein n=1 Tax=Coniochaeta ligniaria NRRL 30616 TaxID=1408157 RepID=A0A1J7K555_9PEZI|nr:hypothetical protein CONLIGDRAFT_54636 [Coniochaeta ligniaria NRRL 30616]